MSEASPKIDIQNKVILITGAAQGIGLAISKALLKNGARVSSIRAGLSRKNDNKLWYCVLQYYQISMIDVDEKTGLAACTELQKEYSTKSVMFTRCDVTKPDELVSQQHGQIMWLAICFIPFLSTEKCICTDQGWIWWHWYRLQQCWNLKWEAMEIDGGHKLGT